MVSAEADKIMQRRWAYVMAGLAAVAAGWWLLAHRGYRPAPDALAAYREGVAALEDGTYYHASQALERAAARDPQFVLARARLAEAYFELDLSEKARQTAPHGGDPLVEAIQLTVSGKFPEAAKLYQDIAANAGSGEKSDAYIDLGRAYERESQPADAIEAYRQATRRGPRNRAAWLRLGRLYQRHLQQDRAAQALARAAELGYREEVESGPEYLTPPRLIEAGYRQFAKGDDDQARQSYTQARDLAHRYGMEHTEALALAGLGNLDARAGDADRAIESLQPAAALFLRDGYRQDCVDTLTVLARMQHRKGDLAGALVSYQQQVQLGGGEPAVHAMGEMYLEQGRLPEALAAFQNAADTARNSGDRLAASFGQLDLAAVYLRLGRLDDAQHAIDSSGPSPSRAVADRANESRAELALRRHDYARAIELSQHVLRGYNLGVDLTVEAKCTLGSAKMATGERAEGRALLAEAVRLAAESDSLLVRADARQALAAAH